MIFAMEIFGSLHRWKHTALGRLARTMNIFRIIEWPELLLSFNGVALRCDTHTHTLTTLLDWKCLQPITRHQMHRITCLFFLLIHNILIIIIICHSMFTHSVLRIIIFLVCFNSRFSLGVCVCVCIHLILGFIRSEAFMFRCQCAERKRMLDVTGKMLKHKTK